MVSAIFLYIAFKGVNVDELLAALKKCNYLYIIPAVAVMYGLFIIRTLRWDYLVRPITNASFKNLFSATMIGFMANNTLPFRLGEFARAYVLAKDEDAKMSAVFATIVIERLFDGMTILLILMATFLTVDLTKIISPEATENIKSLGYSSFGLYLVIIAFIIFLNRRYDSAMKLAGFFLKPFPEKFTNFILKLLDSFSSGLKIEKNFKNIFMILFYSLLHWIFCALPIYIVLKGFDLQTFDYSLAIEASFVVLIMKTFAVMIPAAPGYIGTLNVAVVIALAFYGVPKAEAVSISIIIWAVDFLPPVILGAILLWTKNISIKSIEEAKDADVAMGG